jgi:MFS transporter, SP family, sugar:H+ symporter
VEAARLSGGAAVTALLAINVFAVGFRGDLGTGDVVDAQRAVRQRPADRGGGGLHGGELDDQLGSDQDIPAPGRVGLSFAYGLYTAFAALAFIFVLKVLPETRGRTLS